MDQDASGLLAGAAGGDAASWNALVERFSGLLWSIARSYRLSDADAADVLQTTWLRLLEHLERIGANLSELRVETPTLEDLFLKLTGHALRT